MLIYNNHVPSEFIHILNLDIMSLRIYQRHALKSNTSKSALTRAPRGVVRVMATASPLSFAKYHGLGNDFILVSLGGWALRTQDFRLQPAAIRCQPAD